MAIPDFVVRPAGATQVTSKRVDMRVDMSRQLAAMAVLSAHKLVEEHQSRHRDSHQIQKMRLIRPRYRKSEVETIVERLAGNRWRNLP